jgi:hypothetical protein
MNFPRIFHLKESQDQGDISKTVLQPTSPKEEALVLVVEVSKGADAVWHCDVQNHSINALDFDEAHRIVLELATKHLTLNTPVVVPTEETPDAQAEPIPDNPPTQD